MPALPPPIPLAEIVVTGRGLDAAASDAAYDVVTIDRSRLAASASGRLEEVLRDAAGFAQFRRSDSRSAHPTSQGATLRGLGGNASSRALVVLDGVPQVDPFGGWINFAALDPGRLGEARITRGGGSGVYGPGALAGTIELDSAGPGELAPLQAGVAYGSRDSLDADAALARRLGAGLATLAANYQRGDGFVPIAARQRGLVDTGARYEQGSLAARVIAPLAPDTELQASLLLFSDARTRGLAFTDNRSRGGDASLRLVGRGRWAWEALGYIQLRDFRSNFASANPARTIVTRSLDQYSVPATGLGGRIELRPPVGQHLALRVGGDARRTDGETNEYFSYTAGLPTRVRRAGGVTATAGGFAELTADAGPATLTAAGRLDRWWITDGHLNERLLATSASLTDIAFANRHGTEATARGGVSFRAARGLRLRAAAYTGWRLPTLNELYRPFRAGLDATAANPALRPERVRGVDGGIDWSPLPSIRLAATLFHNRLSDAIGNVTAGVGPGTFPQVGVVNAGGVFRRRDNLDAVRANGAELEGRVTDGRWSLAASYAYTAARVRASGPAAPLDGLRPAQTPRHQASATLGYEALSGLRTSATLRYVGPQFEDDQNSRALVAATTLDLTAGLPLGRRLTLEARAENVTGTRVEATLAADGTVERATPRTLWLGLRFSG